MSSRTPRLIAGVTVLVVLIGLAVVLIPPYASNWELQSYVNDLADDTSTAHKPVDTVRAQVLDKARSLRLPVQSDDVHVTISQGAVQIEVLYIVQVNVAG